MKKVFTFWEPKENIPGYVTLCMETWTRHLAGSETVVLDYDSLGDYLTADEQAEILCKRMPLAMQSDCIRCAVLKKHGGIWLDADTIMTKPLDARFFAADCNIVAWRQDGHLVHYAAFISAMRPEARFLCEWHRRLAPRVVRAEKLRSRALQRFLRQREWKLVRRWNYAVNGIIDPLSDTATAPDYSYIDKGEIRAVPEEKLMAGPPPISATEAYRRYWLEPGDPADAIEGNAGIIMLHNSFTPERFRRMSDGEFLATDTRLAKLLSVLLKS